MNYQSLNTPFLLIKSENSSDIAFYSFDKMYKSGTLKETEALYPNISNTFILMPFSSVKEKYLHINIKQNSPILSAKINDKTILNINHFNEYLKYQCTLKESKFEISDEDFKTNVRNVIDQEIKNGSGSNFLVVQKLTGYIENFDLNSALGLFARLCANEYGAYQIFCLFTGEFYLVGASPECHLNIENKRVRMQPISGTYRKTGESIQVQKAKILDFLNDRKEINELFMTVDEELKMMAKICSSGGMVIGPRLREMSRVIHTEYLLTGESGMNKLDILKESMFAATVVGSPLKKAVEISEKYGDINRGYYSGLIGIFGDRDNFDSSIVLRSIMVDKAGYFEACAGASIVQDSVPENELLEVKAKLSAILSNLSLNSEEKPIMSYLQFDHNICENLCKRNQNLSNFLFFDKNGKYTLDKDLLGKKVVIINNEDDFTNSLFHILTKMGLVCQIVDYFNFRLTDYDKSTLIIIGPGPGNPNDTTSNKMQRLLQILKELINSDFKFAGICLGHQIIAKSLGFEVIGKNCTQGEQRLIDYFGKQELVGFYNTFYAKYNKPLENLTICYDQNTADIYAIRGEEFFSMQFHPESLLTQNGYEILLNELKILIKNTYKASKITDFSLENLEEFYCNLKSKMVSFELADKKVFDVCGTGGSGKQRVNLSTVLALSLSKNFTIAKHANKASSGKVGSVNILEEMSYKIAKNPDEARDLIDKNNAVFLFAPAFHPEIAKFSEIRKQLKVPTIFNFVMPLLNPVANLKAQMVGVSDVKMMKLMAKLAVKLNKNVIFVHDLDNGLDDVSITGTSLIIEVFGGKMDEYLIKPEDFGIKRVEDFSLIAGFDNAKDNADLAMKILLGSAEEAYLNFLKINKLVASRFFNKF